LPTYVAKRPDGLVLRDGKKIAAGEVVTDFNTWPEVVKRAHLSLAWVERVADPPTDGVEIAVAETPGLAPNQCATCGQTFATPKALRRHRH
jgi:hypothetical protein